MQTLRGYAQQLVVGNMAQAATAVVETRAAQHLSFDWLQSGYNRLHMSSKQVNCGASHAPCRTFSFLQQFVRNAGWCMLLCQGTINGVRYWWVEDLLDFKGKAFLAECARRQSQQQVCFHQQCCCYPLQVAQCECDVQN